MVTNAHVVGLKEDKYKGPRVIELVFNSGEGDNEYHYGGELVAYDREHDLAILRPFLLDVGARQAGPQRDRHLQGADPVLLQKLFVFGYPLGESIGKEITVSETSISSLRKTPRPANSSGFRSRAASTTATRAARWWTCKGTWSVWRSQSTRGRTSGSPSPARWFRSSSPRTGSEPGYLVPMQNRWFAPRTYSRPLATAGEANTSSLSLLSPSSLNLGFASKT